jgi:Nucleotidyl transferase AbiEii toxin, Type IV TA system
LAELEPYASAAGVEAAIKDAARKGAAADPSLTVNERIRLEYFNRFLSRVFSEGTESEWLLKGGTGMLARVPSTRTTLDIDLYRNGFTLDQALAELRRLAEIDLRDHFRFVYTGHETSIGGEEQPYTDGYRVAFDVYIGAKRKSALNVDLAIGAELTASVTTMEPASALSLPRLVHHEYRLYPLVDQIADKVCATMKTYGDRPSSREKDLVDLVVLAVTQDVDGTALGVAISTEERRRQMEPFDHFVVPNEWGRGYGRLAKSVPYCSDFATAELARDLVTRFIDPALDGTANGETWSCETRTWTWT